MRGATKYSAKRLTNQGNYYEEFLTLKYKNSGGSTGLEEMVLKRNGNGSGAVKNRLFSMQIESSRLMPFVPDCYFAEHSPVTGVTAILPFFNLLFAVSPF